MGGGGRLAGNACLPAYLFNLSCKSPTGVDSRSELSHPGHPFPNSFQVTRGPAGQYHPGAAIRLPRTGFLSSCQSCDMSYFPLTGGRSLGECFLQVLFDPPPPHFKDFLCNFTLTSVREPCPEFSPSQSRIQISI